ncbi:unnamed protein product [Closterium sp. NIES-64]|nr:unnamed protein product [Closterium sp. NIES-64]
MLLVFVVDTSPSMGQRIANGLTLLDCGRFFPFAIPLHPYTPILTCPVFSRSSLPQVVDRFPFTNFLRVLKAVKVGGLSSIGQSLRATFDLLHTQRLAADVDRWGMGRNLASVDPTVVMLLTDGTHFTSVPVNKSTSLALLPATNSTPLGGELASQPFRWDQHVLATILRIPSAKPEHLLRTGPLPAPLHKPSSPFPHSPPWFLPPPAPTRPPPHPPQTLPHLQRFGASTNLALLPNATPAPLGGELASQPFRWRFGVSTSLGLLPATNSPPPGGELASQPFRWEQRVLATILRIPSAKPEHLDRIGPLPAAGPISESPAAVAVDTSVSALCEATGWVGESRLAILRIPGAKPEHLERIGPLPAAGPISESPAAVAVDTSVSALGKCSVVTSWKMLFQHLDIVASRLSPAVVVSFDHVPLPGGAPMPPQVHAACQRKLLFVRNLPTTGPAGSAAGLAAPGAAGLAGQLGLAPPQPAAGPPPVVWPIPEAFWPDFTTPSAATAAAAGAAGTPGAPNISSSPPTVPPIFPPRDPHPVITYRAVDTDARVPPGIPVDKYEIEGCPILGFLSKAGPNVCWQVRLGQVGCWSAQAGAARDTESLLHLSLWLAVAHMPGCASFTLILTYYGILCSPAHYDDALLNPIPPLHACTPLCLHAMHPYPHPMQPCLHAMLPCLHAVLPCLHAMLPCLHSMLPCLHAMLPCLHAMLPCLHAMLPCLHAMLPCLHAMLPCLHAMLPCLHAMLPCLHAMLPCLHAMLPCLHACRYLRVNRPGSSLTLHVLPYNYPVLFPLVEQLQRMPPHTRASPPAGWRHDFERYCTGVPPYYAAPLRAAMRRLGVSAAGAAVPDLMDASLAAGPVASQLRRWRVKAKGEIEERLQEIAKTANQMAQSAAARPPPLPTLSFKVPLALLSAVQLPSDKPNQQKQQQQVQQQQRVVQLLPPPPPPRSFPVFPIPPPPLASQPTLSLASTNPLVPSVPPSLPGAVEAGEAGAYSGGAYNGGSNSSGATGAAAGAGAAVGPPGGSGGGEAPGAGQGRPATIFTNPCEVSREDSLRQVLQLPLRLAAILSSSSPAFAPGKPSSAFRPTPSQDEGLAVAAGKAGAARAGQGGLKGEVAPLDPIQEERVLQGVGRGRPNWGTAAGAVAAASAADKVAAPWFTGGYDVDRWCALIGAVGKWALLAEEEAKHTVSIEKIDDQDRIKAARTAFGNPYRQDKPDMPTANEAFLRLDDQSPGPPGAGPPAGAGSSGAGSPGAGLSGGAAGGTAAGSGGGGGSAAAGASGASSPSVLALARSQKRRRRSESPAPPSPSPPMSPHPTAPSSPSPPSHTPPSAPSPRLPLSSASPRAVPVQASAAAPAAPHADRALRPDLSAATGSAISPATAEEDKRRELSHPLFMPESCFRAAQAMERRQQESMQWPREAAAGEERGSGGGEEVGVSEGRETEVAVEIGDRGVAGEGRGTGEGRGATEGRGGMEGRGRGAKRRRVIAEGESRDWTVDVGLEERVEEQEDVVALAMRRGNPRWRTVRTPAGNERDQEEVVDFLLSIYRVLRSARPNNTKQLFALLSVPDFPVDKRHFVQQLVEKVRKYVWYERP